MGLTNSEVSHCFRHPKPRGYHPPRRLVCQEHTVCFFNGGSNFRSLARMPNVDRNILRLAAYEMIHPGTPAPVVIDEALELARRFSSGESVGFVNGVLDALRRLLPAK